MIRQPISFRWRVGLGITSVLLLILFYTFLSHRRQTVVRGDQRKVADQMLADLEGRQRELEKRRQAADEIEDQEQRAASLEQAGQEREKLDQEEEKWRRLREKPNAVDLTVPTWSVLLREGLIRAATPQGSFKRKEIWLVTDFTATALRLVAGLVLGALLSVLLGLLMGCFDSCEYFFVPPFAFASKVPTTAVLPIFFILVQINFSMYVAVIIFGVLPTLAQSISQSVRKDVPEELVFKAYTLGASQFELIWEVVKRQVLPRILDSVRLQIGPALVLLVAAEWMVAGEGVGYRLRLFYQRTDMTVIFVYVIILGLVGLAVDYTLIWARRKLCPWFGE